VPSHGSAAAEAHAALGSLHFLCGEDLETAEQHMSEAVRLDKPGDGVGRYCCQLERVRRQRAAQLAIRNAAADPQDGAAPSGLPRFRDVPRRAATSLSVEEFERDFAGKGVPVVVTGLFGEMFPKGKWGWQRIREELGNMAVSVLLLLLLYYSQD